MDTAHDQAKPSVVSAGGRGTIPEDSAATRGAATEPGMFRSRERLPLLRPHRQDGPTRSSGAWFTGVAAGLAAHLQLRPWLARLLFVLSIPTVIGPLLYAWFWIFVPRGNPWSEANLSATVARLATPNETVDTGFRRAPMLTPAVLIGGVLLALAVLVAVTGPEQWSSYYKAMAVAAVLGGVALIWTGAATLDRDGGLGRFLLLAIPGVLIVLFGVLGALSREITLFQTVRGGLVALVVLAVLSLATLPLWARFLRSYKGSLAEQARQTVRADMAAHLHDSVLQTLALIRARAEDPVEVVKLARAEERQLRAWLYTDRVTSAVSLVEVVKEVAAEIEDLHGVAFELVSVGDAVPGDWSLPLVAALREALTNAAKHGSAPYSLYLEVRPEKVECFVRDRGTGFDLETVAADRYGVKESIVARLERYGGKARIKSGENGTEVQMEITR